MTLERRTRLERITPLQPGAPPRRVTPIIRSAINSSPAARTGIRRSKPKPTKLNPDPAWPGAKALILTRDSYRCRRCGKPARTVHHRTARGMGGAMSDPTRHGYARCVTVCDDCHAWIEAHPIAAGADGAGWIVHRGLVTPDMVPVHTVDGLMLFLADGRVIPA